MVRQQLQTPDGPFRQAGQLHRLLPDLHRINILVQIDHGKQIGNDGVQPINLKINICQKIPVNGRIIHLHTQKRFCQHLHGAQRSFQLMRSIGNKFITGAIHVFQLLAHDVKSFSHLPELPAAGYAHLLIQITFAHPGNTGSHFLDGMGNQSGKNKTDQNEWNS